MTAQPLVTSADDGFADLSRDELQKQVAQLKWVHTIDLGNGIVTPGKWGMGNPRVRRALDEIPFQGMKVLDIGCWDGLNAFLAEQRGASEVFATDLVSQRDFPAQPTFQLAHAALKSSAKYYPNLSVYDVEQLGVRDFDVVLFLGVYYHLKDPLRALACLRRVMKDGGLLLVEGAVLRRRGCSAKFYYRRPFRGDYSNWWVPTRACLRQWVCSSFFEIEKEYKWFPFLYTRRHALLARAVSKNDPLFIRPPEGLEAYNVAK
jgi:tRNA (mo5U34)-methyltransferase